MNDFVKNIQIEQQKKINQILNSIQNFMKEFKNRMQSESQYTIISIITKQSNCSFYARIQ